MRSLLSSGIELGLKQIARSLMTAEKYAEFQLNLRRTKLVRVGNGTDTLHDLIVDQAVAIADWATNNGYTEASDKVEAKKKQAIENLKQLIHHV
jgi:hypothetical protein